MAKIPPFSLTFYRWLIVTILLTPFIVKTNIQSWRIIKKQLPLLTILALTGISLYTSLVYFALTKTTVVNAVLINSLVPAVVIIISAIFFKLQDYNIPYHRNFILYCRHYVIVIEGRLVKYNKS